MIRFLYALSTLLFFTACNSSNKTMEEKAKSINYGIVIHGGAGAIIPEKFSKERQQEYEKELAKSLAAGYAILENGGTALDAVQAAILIMEDSPLFNAGKGAVYNSEAKQEMDASIMDGATLNCGAVAGIARVKNPILAARAVMEKSKHVMFTGKGAETFAEQEGIKLMDSSYFHSEKRLKQLQKIQEKEKGATLTAMLFDESSGFSDEKYGTVGAVALDKNGNLAAGTSTGGLTNKKYGRVGDSPIIGAGTYANNASCGISCTGTGEYFIRTVAAHKVSHLVELKEMQADSALHEVLYNQIGKLGGEGGMILLDKSGQYYWDFNTSGMFRGYKGANGENVIKIFSKE